MQSSKQVKKLGILGVAVAALTIPQFSSSAKASGELPAAEAVVQAYSQNFELGESGNTITESAPVVVEKNEIAPLGVDNTATLSLAVGKSWSDSFKMNNWINEDHDAFKVKVSGVTSGKYKVIIKGSDGYSYESSEYSSDQTFTTTKAKTGVTYTVTIVNTSASTLKGKVNITSYIN